MRPTTHTDTLADGIDGAAREHVTPSCPDCGSDSTTDAPAQSRMRWLCEVCGRAFDQTAESLR